MEEVTDLWHLLSAGGGAETSVRLALMIQLSTVSCTFIQYIQIVSLFAPTYALCTFSACPFPTLSSHKCDARVKSPVSHSPSASSCLASLFITPTSVLTSSPITCRPQPPLLLSRLYLCFPSLLFHAAFFEEGFGDLKGQGRRRGTLSASLWCIFLCGNHLDKTARGKTSHESKILVLDE